MTICVGNRQTLPYNTISGDIAINNNNNNNNNDNNINYKTVFFFVLQKLSALVPQNTVVLILFSLNSKGTHILSHTSLKWCEM